MIGVFYLLEMMFCVEVFHAGKKNCGIQEKTQTWILMIKLD